MGFIIFAIVLTIVMMGMDSGLLKYINPKARPYVAWIGILLAIGLLVTGIIVGIHKMNDNSTNHSNINNGTMNGGNNGDNGTVKH